MRYHPSRSPRRTGTTSVSGLAAERRTAAVASCRPSASVTEMIAKRGSTASSKVSATVRGAASSTRLGSGAVRTR